ncbi:MAG TPA: lipoyl(octanoyl) transferase LipB [Fluviicoccus sp.]|nr:lipoyl(octanoyl) transferase LipB [Fluviicoccus sp.]
MLTVRHVNGDFQTVWQAMRDFTDQRTPETPDELWFVQHPPVFTLGQAGKPEHILAAGDIPVVKTDRGGQVTYHGPGQMVGYCLFDLRRTGTGVRELVEFIEDCLVEVLQQHGIAARADRDAHGVYVGERKIASLGLRIRKGCSYHGFALNVNMDPEPFTRINPCGYTGLQMTTVQLEAAVMPPWQTLADDIRKALEKTF